MSELAVSGPGPSRAAGWRKPSRCRRQECVEVSHQNGVVLLRDSARPDAVLSVTAASWRAFTAAIRAGEFDQPG
jgi:hypothetical protein